MDALQVRVQTVLADLTKRMAAGENIQDETVLAEHPDLAEYLRVGLERLRLIHSAGRQAEELEVAPTLAYFPARAPRTSGGLAIRCPHCGEQFAANLDTPVTEIACSNCGNRFSLAGTNAEARDAAALASLGRFDILERIGIGGFGTVWKGRDSKLDRVVAIKVPRKGSLDENDVEKFLREARAAAQLSHPHIVSVHEIGRDGSRVFIVSDYVRGMSLEQWLRSQRPTIRQAVSLCIFVAEALHHAHEQGVIHRDLKPANIMISTDGKPRVMDFGLARREVGEVTMTLDGQLLGTPAYMSPEQALGKGHESDRRSDTYSLGVILFELLTGEKPFRGDYVQLIQQVISDAPPSPRKFNRNIPLDLETITLKCLEKQPAQRFQSARELAEELRRFLRNEPILARPILPVERAFRWAKREPLLASLCFAVVVLSVVSTVAAFSFFARKEAIRAALERETELHGEAQAAAERAIKLQNEAQLAAVNERSARATLETQKQQLVQANRGAEQSRSEATSALYHSLVQQARATRLAGQSGFRDSVLQLVRRAAQLDTGSVDKSELRDIAVSSLGDVAGATPLVIEGYNSPITSVAISQGGQQVVTGHEDGMVIVRDKRGDGPPITIHRHDAPVAMLLLDERSGHVVSATGDGHVLQSQPRSQTQWKVAAVTQLSGALRSLSKSSSARVYATIHGPDSLQFVDIESNEKIGAIKPNDSTASATLSPDLRTSALWRGMSFRFDLIEPRDDANSDWESSPFGFVHDIAFSADSTTAAVGCEEGLLVRIVDEKTNLIYRRDIPVRKVFILDGNRLIAYVTLSRDVVIWDYVANAEVARLRHSMRVGALPAVAVSANGDCIASALSTEVQILNTTHTPEKRSAPAHNSQITGLAVYPSGEAMATLAADGSVRLWRLPNLDLLAESRDGGIYSRALAVHPAEKVLIVGGWPFKLLDAATLKKLGEVKHPVGNTWQLVFSPDGNYFGASGDRSTCVWQSDDLLDEQSLAQSRSVKPLETLCKRSGSNLCFDRSSQWVGWSVPETGELQAKRIGTKSLHVCPKRFGGTLRGALPFLKDAEFLFVDGEGFMNTWHVENEANINRIGHVGNGLAFPFAIAQDATRIALSTNPISVWDPKESRRLYGLPRDGAAIYCMGWTADGNRLCIGLSDGSVTVWNIDQVDETLSNLQLD